MPGVAHQIFNRMFVPTVILGIWGYANFESIRAEGARGAWREENANPPRHPSLTPAPPTRLMDPPDARPGDDDSGRAGSDIPR
jgi:hypothetical protein